MIFSVATQWFSFHNQDARNFKSFLWCSYFCAQRMERKLVLCVKTAVDEFHVRRSRQSLQYLIYKEYGGCLSHRYTGGTWWYSIYNIANPASCGVTMVWRMLRVILVCRNCLRHSKTMWQNFHGGGRPGDSIEVWRSPLFFLWGWQQVKFYSDWVRNFLLLLQYTSSVWSFLISIKLNLCWELGVFFSSWNIPWEG